MSANNLSAMARGSFLDSIKTQARVIGALMMRELHTRYGRENIGYLWLVGEPLMLATVISSLHATGHTPYGSDIKPLPFTVIGYTTFIMFRGIVNRSEGSMEANAPLLYHRTVTTFDVTLSRALIEACGTILAYTIIILILSALGLAALPLRPLFLYLGLAFMFWWSFAHSMIITGISHDNRTIGRFVHPYTYFSIPFSGAFFQVEWLPEPYRHYLLWYPMPHILEMVRYGQFRSANLRYVDFGYVALVCSIMTVIGLLCMRLLRGRIHLS